MAESARVALMVSIRERLSEKRAEVLRAAARYGAGTVRMIGSVARGEAGPDSDLDLLVELVRKLSEGATEADLLEAYPHLTIDDIRTALAYAADLVAQEESVLLTSPPDGAAGS